MNEIWFYLCGRMTGIPAFNFPRFDYVALDLRENYKWDGKRIKIVSPAELDDPKTRKAALASPDGSPGSGSTAGETWGDFLARDLKLIADGKPEGIVTMEEWWKSKGGRVETFIARLMGYPILRYEDGKPLRYVTVTEMAKAHYLSKTERDIYAVRR